MSIACLLIGLIYAAESVFLQNLIPVCGHL